MHLFYTGSRGRLSLNRAKINKYIDLVQYVRYPRAVGDSSGLSGQVD